MAKSGLEKIYIYALIALIFGCFLVLGNFKQMASPQKSPQKSEQGQIEPEEGINGQPKVAIHHSSGASAEVYLHGATVTSYKNFRGVEMLFVSKEAKFDGSSVIRGGIPLVFPQFAEQGPLPKHGVVRDAPWRCIELNELNGVGKFEFRPEGELYPEWKHSVRLVYTVKIGEESLSTVLEVFNEGNEVIQFDALQHTYYQLYDVRSTTFSGLYGVHFKDKTQSFKEFEETYEVNVIQGEMDRIYQSVPEERVIKLTGVGKPERHSGVGQGTYTAHIQAFVETEKNDGSSDRRPADIVVWNCGEQKAKEIEDLGDREFEKYACVEPGQVSEHAELSPSDHSWRLSQVVHFTS